MNVVHNFQNFRVLYKCFTELAEVLCRVIPGLNTLGMVCTYPTEHTLGFFPYTSPDPASYEIDPRVGLRLLVGLGPDTR